MSTKDIHLNQTPTEFSFNLEKFFGMAVVNAVMDIFSVSSDVSNSVPKNRN